jgi:hypothetical protein
MMSTTVTGATMTGAAITGPGADRPAGHRATMPGMAWLSRLPRLAPWKMPASASVRRNYERTYRSRSD